MSLSAVCAGSGDRASHSQGDSVSGLHPGGVTVDRRRRATMRAMAKTKSTNGKAAPTAPTTKMPEHVGDDIVAHLMVEPGTKADLKKRAPGWKAGKPFELMATDDLKAF